MSDDPRPETSPDSGVESAPGVPAQSPEDEDAVVALVAVTKGQTTPAGLWWPYGATVVVHPDPGVRREHLAARFGAHELAPLVHDVREHLERVERAVGRHLVAGWELDRSRQGWVALADQHDIDWRGKDKREGETS